MAVSTIDALYNGTSEKLTTSATGITVTGNVGIGTSSPSRQLEIYDDGTVGQAVLALTAQNTDPSRIMFADPDDSNIGILDYAHSDNSMRFVVNNAERMRLDASGRLLLGTSTSFADGNSENLQIAGSGNTGMMIKSGTANYGSIYFGDATSGGARNAGIVRYFHNDNSMQFWTNETERMRVLSSGGITFNGDTAAANALNDYEEGTWTPTATNGGSFSNSAYGTYTKIGNVVTLHATLIVSSNSSGLGFGITSLPFAQSSSNTEAAAGFYMRYTTDSTYRMFYLSNGSVISVYNLGGGATTFSTASTKRYDFSGVYYTDS